MQTIPAGGMAILAGWSDAICYRVIKSIVMTEQELKGRIVALVKANLDIIRVLDVNHKDVERKELRKLKKAS